MNLTPRQFKQKKEKLLELKARLEKIKKGMAEAASYGGADLHKIPEYAALADEAASLRPVISRLEAELVVAAVADAHALPQNIISVASTVTVVDLASGKEETYHYEAGGGKGLELTLHSPLGRALLGKKAGDEITVSVPAGVRTLKVVRVEVC